MLAQPKPTSLKTLKGRTARQRQAKTALIRAYVFARDQETCRCCGRPAASMHEIRPRSLGGTVSAENSVSLCGDGVRGCHGLIQRHEISCEPISGQNGAEGGLVFTACTMAASTHVAGGPSAWRAAFP